MQDTQEVVAGNQEYSAEGGLGDQATLGLTAVARKVHCKIHPRYKGLRRPRLQCEECAVVFNYKRAAGIREHRRKQPKGD